MRRVVAFFFLTCVAAACFAGAETAKAPFMDSVMVDLVPTIVAAAGGSFVLDLEAQTAITDAWSLFFDYETGSLSGLPMFDLEIGPQVRPWRGHLAGAWVGVYPGFASISSTTQTDWIAGATAETGYEWILDPGIALAVSAGASWYSGSTALSGLRGTAGVRIGYAFTVPGLHGK